MYNQVNHGPHFRQGPHTPMPPAYQQYPQAPPPLIQQGHPAAPVQHMPTVLPHSGLPAPHIYLHGPPTTSSTVPQNSSVQVPPGVVQKTVQSYVLPPPLLHGNTMMPHTFSSAGQNSQHSSNSGVQNHHIPPPGPPPSLGHTHQETSWVPVPPLPPPPSSSSQGQTLYKPPFLPCPPQPGDGQSLLHGPPPLLPLAPTSGFLVPTPHGYSAVGSCELPSITAPPLPLSPPPVSPSPPPLATSVASVSTLSNRGCDLPPPPPQPMEANTVQKIKTLCQLIAENGPHIEDKTRQDESGNLDYSFLFGGDPGSEAAISHEYFIWMKKKCILEHRWHDKKSESQLRPLAVDSPRLHDHLNFASECNLAADSDMEMEDDITLSDKDQGLNYTIEGLNQQHDRVDKQFSTNEQIHQLQNSTENDPIKDILSSEVSGLGSLGISKQNEGLSDSEHIKYGRSVAKVHSPVNDSTEVAELPLGTVSEKSAAPLADDYSQGGVCNPAEAINPVRDSGQLLRSGSPIRLLQDYASDDTSDNEDGTCFSDVNVLTDIGSRSPFRTQKELGILSKISRNDSEISPNLVEEIKGTRTRSVSSGTADGCVQHNLENQVSVNFSASVEAFQGKDGLSSAGIESGSKGYTVEQEDEKKTSKFELTPLKVDEFGRFVREGPADSDSDDSRYRQTRRKNKRDRSRSRSRSRSPLERRSRRRRRRSPWRRKDKRSRSRSWSPRKRRSRSRSPILRRSGEFYGDNMKRDKGQCHNFLQGKCYRGASCRYMHHESDTISSSRHHRNKHDLEIPSSQNSRIHEGVKNISAKVSGHERDRVRSQDVQLCQNVSGSSTSQEAQKRKEDSVRNAVVSTTSHHDGQLVDTIPIKFESSREVAPKVREIIEEPNTVIHGIESFHKAVDSHQQLLVDGFPPQALSSGDALKLPTGAPQDVIPSENGSSVQQFQSNVSVGALVHSDHPSWHINEPFVSESLPDKRSMTSGSMISSIEPLPYMLPSTQVQSATSSVGQWLSSEQPPLHSQTSKELPSYGASARDLPLNSYQLPPPPPLSHSQGENAMHMPQMSRDYGMVQQNAFFPYQSTTRESFQAYPALLHTQNSHFSVPSSSSWTILPPPPSQAVYSSNFSAALATSHVSSEFNQSQLHSRTDFVSQTLARPGLPSHSQGSEYQDQARPPILEQSRPLMLTEALTSKALPQGNPTNQSFASPNLGREDPFKQLAVQDSQFSSSSSFGGLHTQPKHFSWEPDANKLQPSSGDKLPPEEHFKTSSHTHPFSQKQQPVHGLQYSVSDGNLDVPGDTLTVSRYPPDVMDSIHSASLPDFGGSRISAHYNPYASTFERPLSSKFSTNIFSQEKDIIHGNNYGSSSSLNHTPPNGQDLSGVGSRQTASLPKSAGTIEQILPRSGGDQYDPLFDSIEPSSTSLKKFDLDQKQEVTGESNISLRPKSSYKSLDVEENNKHGEIGAVASTTSQNNDEYGETADAEVGVVENESLSNPMDVANMNSGDIEIDQIKSPGKRKKSKDSRSMKLFKVSIANFVKEVLKPSWRQGNMSKVAFKTIVKKTVDKVSGAMKGHRVPKSQAKINQYIDSSQRKLTKLVMGYVDKYVKV